MSKELWDELEKKIGKPCPHYFRANIEVSYEDKKSSFEFAKKMSMENNHNPDSFASGKKENERKPSQIFRDAFQGKIAEFAFCNFVKNRSKDNENLKPDLECWARGEWEDTDFVITNGCKQYTCSIKSTKDFGRLLLLERKRYDENGLYIEPAKNGNTPVKHDFFFLLRVEGVKETMCYFDYSEQDIRDIKVEFAGYITHKIFLDALGDKERILKAGTKIGNDKLKVDNVWFCVSELQNKFSTQ